MTLTVELASCSGVLRKARWRRLAGVVTDDDDEEDDGHNGLEAKRRGEVPTLADT